MTSPCFEKFQLVWRTIIPLAKVSDVSFPNSVHDLQTWQKGLLLLLVPGIIAICTIIGREIYFAVHPDKRPRKRRRRPPRE
jgi:hypothetical protein